MLQHEILIRAYANSDAIAFLEVRCACGMFILDREGGEASLVEITQLIAAHYMLVKSPEKANGNKLIKGKK